MIASNHPEIKAYYDELGADRIKALGYKESSLKNEIKNRQEKGHLILEFKRIFKPGMRLTSDEVKLQMTKVYSFFGIKRNAVATHLEKEYGIKCKRIKISDNGSRVSGWEFL